LAVSVADFRCWIEVEKAARGADAKTVRRIWRVARRRVAVSVRNDILIDWYLVRWIGFIVEA
jgi:hypothetical protein